MRRAVLQSFRATTALGKRRAWTAVGAMRLLGSGPHVWGNIPGPSTGNAGRKGRRGDGPQPVVRGGGSKGPEVEVDFFQESKALFDRVERGVEGMKDVNKHFVVSRSELEVVIDLGPDKGAFTLQRDVGKNEIMCMSPHSGAHRYTFSPEERRWLSIESDRHDLVGILTRDLIRHAAGCPQI